MKYLLLILRIGIGGILTIFGLFRGMDAVGFSYKINEYIKLFIADDFEVLSLPIALIFCAAIFASGVALLSGIKPRIATWMAMAMTFPAMIVSFISWQNNVIHNCVCFGDIFSFDNALYNFIARLLVLTGLILLAVVFRADKYASYIYLRYSSIMMWAILFNILLGIYGSLNFPLIDFRPYYEGVNILESMAMPENAPGFEYETILYYRNKKTEAVKPFTEQNFPWQDKDNWAFHHRETKLVKEGYVPPITDFSIKTEDDTDITLEVLQDHNYNFLIIAEDVSRSNLNVQTRLNQLYEYCKTNGYGFRCLTASTPKQIARFKIISGAEYEFCTTDATVLKTMLTSNPGLILLKDAVIVKKWHFNNIPTVTKLKKRYNLVNNQES